MKTWAISGIDVPTLYIPADCFDDAIKQARQFDRRYSGGCIHSQAQTMHQHGEMICKHADGSCDYWVND